MLYITVLHLTIKDCSSQPNRYHTLNTLSSIALEPQWTRSTVQVRSLLDQDELRIPIIECGVKHRSKIKQLNSFVVPDYKCLFVSSSFLSR